MLWPVRSKRSIEGTLIIDHRAGDPGPSMRGPGTRRGLYESATITCHGCHAIVVLRPERTREKAWCFKHDKYLCDRCAILAKVHGCKPLTQVLDDLQTKAVRDQVDAKLGFAS